MSDDPVVTLVVVAVLVLVAMGMMLSNKRNNNVIFLDNFSETTKVYTKITKRDVNRFNKIVNKKDKVTIVIPENVYSITPKFFEDLLKESVLKLGKKKFNEKFRFVTMGYEYERNLNEGIIRIERKRQYEFVLD